MPISPSNFTQGTRTFNYDHDEFGDAKITYLPTAVTPDALDEVRAAGGDADAAVVGLLSKLIVDWDVYEGDPTEGASKWPTTIEGLKRLPLLFLADVLKQIQEDVAPGKVQ